ncbi:MAG TPA: preprotein translocase subunit SecG, partial [Mariniflexile sp.]
LDKSTWALATLLLILILLSNVAINKGGESADSKALDPDATTSQPLPTPAQPANNTDPAK